MWRIGGEDGFVRDFVAERFEALEFLDGAAVEALALGLVAEEEGEGIGLRGDGVESAGECIGAVLGGGDFDISDQVLVEGMVQEVIVADRFVEAGGEEAGFKGGGAEQGVLGQGDALDGEEFLRVDGLIGGDEVVLKAGNGVEFFEADDSELFGVEAVLAGVLGGAGLALGGAGSGGAGGVGAVGGDALGGGGGLTGGLRGAGHGGLPFCFRCGTSWGAGGGLGRGCG